MVVAAEHDRTPSNGLATAASLRNGTFHRVQGAGPYIPIERTSELAANVRRVIALR